MGINLKNFLEITNGKHFYVMDTETTGYKAYEADAIEVSALKVYNDNGNLTLVDKFDSFINPHYPLPPKIVEFNIESGTGICDELLSTQPDADVVAEKLVKFLGDDFNELYIVGHNSDKFDMPFIEKLLEAGGYELDVEGSFDTLLFIQSKEGIIKGAHKLGAIHERTDKAFASGQQYHLSIDDCLATLDVMMYELKRFHPEMIKEEKKHGIQFDFGY